jgi:hypothetical protein
VCQITEVLVLPSTDYMEIIGNEEKTKFQDKVNMLQKVGVFNSWSMEKLECLATVTRETMFPMGTTVTRFSYNTSFMQ